MDQVLAGERFPCRCELAVCSVGAMTNMMGGTGVMWLWMGIGAIVTLALTAAVVVVADRWWAMALARR